MKDDPAPYCERFDAPVYSVLSQCNGCIYMKDFGKGFASGCEIISPEHSTPAEYAANYKKCEHRRTKPENT